MESIVHRKRQTFHIPSTRNEKVEIKAVEESATRLSKRHVSLSTHTECYNFTGQVINTLDHTGLLIRHEPITTVPEINDHVGCFVFAKTYQVGDLTQVIDYDSIVPAWAQAPEDDRAERFFTRHVVKRLNKKHDRLSKKTTMHYIVVRNSDIVKNGGSMYIHDVDIVVFTQHVTDVVVHPNSQRANDLRRDQLYDSAHTYSIEINDALGDGSPYYVNLNGKVVTIQPTQNEFIGDSVKIVYKRPNCPAETIYAGPINEEELKSAGVFKNYSDADKYGTRLEIEKEQLVQQNTLGKLQLERAKVDSAMTTSELKTQNEVTALEAKLHELSAKAEQSRQEREQEEVKHQANVEKYRRELEQEREKYSREMQALRERDYYEQRSHYRKDASEGIKTTHVILGGALALFALWNK